MVGIPWDLVQPLIAFGAGKCIAPLLIPAAAIDSVMCMSTMTTLLTNPTTITTKKNLYVGSFVFQLLMLRKNSDYLEAVVATVNSDHIACVIRAGIARQIHR